MTVTTTRPAPPKAKAPHPLRAEAIRGFAPLAGLAALLTLVSMLVAAPDNWQGAWAETARVLHTAQLITLPMAAAAGCWQGGRERRRRTAELWGTAVRPPLTRLLAAALPSAVWVVLGYLLAFAAASLATWPYSMGDHPHLASLPGDATALVAAVLVGHVAGRAVPTVLAAPVVAIAGYVLLGVAGSHGSVSSLSPAAYIWPTHEPVWWQPLAMAGWTLGLAAALTLVYAARRRVTALLPLTAAAACGALLLHTGSGLWQPDPYAGRQACDTSVTPAVCVSARYGRLLPQVSDALSGVTGKLRGVRNLPVRWEDHAGDPHADETELPMITPFGSSVVRGRMTEPKRYAWEAVSLMQGRDDCHNPPARVSLADDAVSAYLAPSPEQDIFDRLDAKNDASHRAALRARLAARAKLAGMDEEHRRAWLSAYFAARHDCELKGVPAL
ncbi:hypothetical protein [Streptomyces sp. NPDC005435]|uniref:hypothetical protein n=1 Tax=Streptomyces sp. NPDC005435 TaxID=3154464 RepID=UPI00345330B7